jgi:hypothetical protein
MKSCLCIALFSLTASAASAQGDMRLFPPPAIEWKDGPASLPKGAKMAVLEGDPAQPGMFTMRLWFPANFQVAPHWHTQIEHVTIVSGVLHIGMGEKFERSGTREMPTGSFGYWLPGTRHFAWTEGETVLQLHGQGPWTITYVNPADDPRHRPEP